MGKRDALVKKMGKADKKWKDKAYEGLGGLAVQKAYERVINVNRELNAYCNIVQEKKNKWRVAKKAMAVLAESLETLKDFNDIVSSTAETASEVLEGYNIDKKYLDAPKENEKNSAYVFDVPPVISGDTKLSDLEKALPVKNDSCITARQNLIMDLIRDFNKTKSEFDSKVTMEKDAKKKKKKKKK